MRAIILAGGRGTRLAPYTTVIPKPLLPVGDMPIIEIILRQLIHAKFDQVTLSLGYMKEYFRAFLTEHAWLSTLTQIDIVEEITPTGTAGSLAYVDGLEETFLVMNGDILTDLDFNSLVKYHRAQGAMLTIAAYHKKVNIDLGVIEIDSQGLVLDYIEKPIVRHLVSMGVYVYEPRVLDLIERGEYLDFPDLVLRLLHRNAKVCTFDSNASWLDLGRHEDFEIASHLLDEHRRQYLPGG